MDTDLDWACEFHAIVQQVQYKKKMRGHGYFCCDYQLTVLTFITPIILILYLGPLSSDFMLVLYHDPLA